MAAPHLVSLPEFNQTIPPGLMPGLMLVPRRANAPYKPSANYLRFRRAEQNNFYHAQMDKMQYSVAGIEKLRNFIPALLASFPAAIPDYDFSKPRMAALQSRNARGHTMIEIAVKLNHPETMFRIATLLDGADFLRVAKTCNNQTIIDMADQIYTQHIRTERSRRGVRWHELWFDTLIERQTKEASPVEAKKLKTPLGQLAFVMRMPAIQKASRRMGPQLVQ